MFQCCKLIAPNDNAITIHYVVGDAVVAGMPQIDAIFVVRVCGVVIDIVIAGRIQMDAIFVVRVYGIVIDIVVA